MSLSGATNPLIIEWHEGVPPPQLPIAVRRIYANDWFLPKSKAAPHQAGEGQEDARRVVTVEVTTDRAEPADAGLAELLTEIPDVVLVLDNEGRLKWGNRAAERLFGRLLQESIGLPALELVHPDDLELRTSLACKRAAKRGRRSAL